MTGRVGRVVWEWRSVYGTVRASEWERFAHALGLVVERLPLPDGIPAVLAGRSLLIVGERLAAEGAALVAWHEIGHLALHVGDADSWAALPGGDGMLARFEREAWQFAVSFPLWERDDLAAALEALHAAGGVPGALLRALALCTCEEVPA